MSVKLLMLLPSIIIRAINQLPVKSYFENYEIKYVNTWLDYGFKFAIKNISVLSWVEILLLDKVELLWENKIIGSWWIWTTTTENI